MHKETNLPETLKEAAVFYSTGDNAFNLLRSLRWPSGVSCPTCGTSEVQFLSTRKIWQCKNKHPKRQFSVKVGTIFEDSPIGLDKWFMAMWLVMNCKNGVSSYEIHREVGVTQKTGWFMLHRIRLAMEAGSILKDKMQGIVEADETYVGGRAEFMHKNRKKAKGIRPGDGMRQKAAVFGIIQRPSAKQPTSMVSARVLAQKPTKRAVMQVIAETVKLDTEIHTDKSAIYEDVPMQYRHETIDHAEEYVRGHVSTNAMENFWSLLKRALKGTYIAVRPFHLFRYVGEQVLRFNTRKADNHDRFLGLLGRVFGRRITYKQLIARPA